MSAHSTTRVTISGKKSDTDSARAHSSDATPGKSVPVVGDQPTVISSRPPLPAHSSSDSANRIIEGRIMPGDHLGHFELLDYVGGGGMGRVFRASDTRLARIVALKVLSPDQAADAETVQRFQNEAQSAARLDHENIARVHYVGEDRGIHFIAFEFVEGVNVRVLLEQRGPLPLAEAVSYTLQVADALAHADERSVVHRDIKPSNVIITPEGKVKLVDMGLARFRQVDPQAAELTATGVTLGTFDYISPEQARDPRNADIRSDIYSLGCTLFFMLTGRPPFLEGTVLQKLLQHQTEQPPDVREFRPDLPEEIDQLLRRMLAKEPDDRYRNAGELAFELQAIAERYDFQSPVFKNRTWPAAELKPSFWRRHLPWISAVAALVLIVLGLEIYMSATAPPIAPQYSDWPANDKTGPEPSNSRDASSNSVFDSEANKSPSKKALMEKPENDLPPLTPKIDPDKTPIYGDAFSPRSDSLIIPQGESNVYPGISSTAEPYYKNLPLDNRPAITGAGQLAPADGSFALDNRDPLEFPWRKESPFSGIVPAYPGLPGKIADPVASDSAAKQANVLTVGDAGGANEFPTLSAACVKARNGDTIVLRYNGPRVEKPLQLANRRLTIRADEGYSPGIAFQPDEADPVKFPRAMFALQSGRLNLVGVAIDLIVPRNIPAENWSLFEIRGGQTVRLERCILTIDNAFQNGTAYHRDTAFFRVLAGAEDSGAGGFFSAASPLAAIELADSIARGEADFLRHEQLQPTSLTWENGLLTTSETLLLSLGGTKEPQSSDTLNVKLRHVTAIAGGGLCRLTGTPATPHQLSMQWNCSYNIFHCPVGVSLIRQECFSPSDDPLKHIVWNGDLNFYDRIESFWSIRRFGGVESKNEYSMDYRVWQNRWGPSRENLPFCISVDWARFPKSGQPPHLQTPMEYELKQGGENPALSLSSDGLDTGMNFEKLPPTGISPPAKSVPPFNAQ
jgi:serine/threonine-protein kinase